MTASQQPDPPEDTATPSPPRPDRSTFWVAVGLLLVFIVAILGMFALRADGQWDRLVYLYSGLEAIVFAGVGALFGTTVQRGTVTAARADAAQARSDAEQAQQEAQAKADTAARGTALGDTVKGMLVDGAPGGSPIQGTSVRKGARPGDPPTSGPATHADPQLQALARVALRLFPE